MQAVTRLPATDGITASAVILTDWVVTVGNPKVKTWARHTSRDGAMVSGIATG